MKRENAVNASQLHKPSHMWLCRRSWGFKIARRTKPRTAPRWLQRMRMDAAPWGAKAVRAHMRAVEDSVGPALAMLDARTAEIDSEFPKGRE